MGAVRPALVGPSNPQGASIRSTPSAPAPVIRRQCPRGVRPGRPAPSDARPRSGAMPVLRRVSSLDPSRRGRSCAGLAARGAVAGDVGPIGSGREDGPVLIDPPAAWAKVHGAAWLTLPPRPARLARSRCTGSEGCPTRCAAAWPRPAAIATGRRPPTGRAAALRVAGRRCDLVTTLPRSTGRRPRPAGAPCPGAATRATTPSRRA